MRLALVLGMAALLLAGACTGNDDDRPVGPTVPLGGTSTTTSTTVAATSTTLGPASYEVPAVIDQAYVQRVVSAYDKVLGDAIRVLKRDGGLSEEFLKHLLAIYTEAEFDAQVRGWTETLATESPTDRPQTPGDPVTSVLRLVEATPKCVIVRADRNRRATLNTEPEESPQDNYLVLVRRKPNRDPLGVNRTPWVMAFDGAKLDNSVPMNSCDD